jgi:hypothetical protein
MVVKVSDPTGEAWVSVFNEHAEKILGCSADELDRIRKEVNSGLRILVSFSFSKCNSFVCLSVPKCLMV